MIRITTSTDVFIMGWLASSLVDVRSLVPALLFVVNAIRLEYTNAHPAFEARPDAHCFVRLAYVLSNMCSI